MIPNPGGGGGGGGSRGCVSHDLYGNSHLQSHILPRTHASVSTGSDYKAVARGAVLTNL